MLIDESSKTYGRWTVLKYSRVEHKKSYWICICQCGTEKEVQGYNLRSGQSISCGCYQRECVQKLKQLPPGEGAFRQLFNTYKQLAKARELSFDLTRDQFKALTQGNCYYCGIEPCQVLRRKFGTPYTYNGVDRMDSREGYTAANCVPCCGTHNLMKLDMSITEFINACERVVEYQRSLN
jgi:hypothetical protein